MKELQNRYGYDPMKMGESQSSASNVMDELDAACGISGKNWNVPKVIYASRTHSQLTQAMQELKRSPYNFMKAIILGSRDQLSIHPDVSKETNNSAKVQLCKLHMLTRTCSYFLKVEANKNSPHFLAQSIMDIEDLVSVGRKLKTCPYYASRELVQDADIIFMPYNYLLDPKARKANKIELNNTVIILDEAHNVEKMCEKSASVQVKSSDIALCIDGLTQAMKAFSDSALLDGDDDAPKDFTVEDLALFKEMLLDLEKAVDEIEVTPITGGTTFPGGFIFELLAKANITHGNQAMLNRLLESLIQYITAANQSNPVFRRGGGLQVLSDLLTIAFAGKDENADEKIKRCFKVHVDVEEVKEKKTSTKKDGWITPKGGTITKTRAKVINYWCFNPGYGMGQLLCSNVHSIILTSGTLAPLKPLIAELGIPISVRLENPHIVSKSQVYVKIVPFGPDKEPLISNYHNRDNVKYLSSLGRTILSFCPIIPDGLLIFFPSYPLMNKCIDSWQASGIWSQISRHKPIFVEPRGKDAFTSTMTEFYEKINDPTTKGACFMAVCRGKVSEGLDFADKNGRAVIITGLPFPPFKDPRVMLKKKYLEENRTRENELLSGDSWYALEGIRAVNQAIGRVIRHKDDYGAILLCDSRFSMSSQRSQLSAWIQTHLQNTQPPSNFGQFISEMSRFFRNAQSTLPQPCKREITSFSESTEDNKRFQLELADIGAVRKRLNIPSRPTPNM
ncbi:unnamed protein product [Hermetia illucens]|uniref:Regulator of telomere elongation helicase 1 homolog n=1 Tax=Hermetia illucens TaxID=343691 RepID=A0A7R8V258_HERIL|nr:unnamed protein product [Hermetia illucens]